MNLTLTSWSNSNFHLGAVECSSLIWMNRHIDSGRAILMGQSGQFCKGGW
jgi:hypothetical protein